MSREDLRNFIKAVEHNIFVREKLALCRTKNELMLLAKNYGYSITLEDFKYDKKASKFEAWFKKSRINTLKYFN